MGICAIYDTILPKIGYFLENRRFIKILIFASARAQDISRTLTPIGLKFSGMINVYKTNRMIELFFLYFSFLPFFWGGSRGGRNPFFEKS